MLRRWIPGLMALAVVLLVAESAFAQRLLDRIRARREGRQNNYVQTVQSQPQQQANVEQQQPASTPVTYTVYERRGLFGRRMVPVTVTRSQPQPAAGQPATSTEGNVVTTYERRGLFGRRLVPVQTVARATNNQQPQPPQPQPVVGQPASSTVSQGTVTYYERRGLFGRRMVPVQRAASTTVSDGTTTRRAFYLEPGSQAVLLNVRVPANAEVLVDGQRTNQVGTARQFISPPLAPGFEYTYMVEARWQENGQPVTKTRKVTVQPGREATIDFNQPE